MIMYCNCAGGSACHLHGQPARQPASANVAGYRLYRMLGGRKSLVMQGTLQECMQRVDSEPQNTYELTVLKEYRVLMKGQTRED